MATLMENATFSHEFIEFLSSLNGPAAYLTIFGILFACGLGIPIPEDITLLAAGIVAASGSISLPGAFLVGYLGVLVGDALLFFAGRKYGHKVFRVWPFSRMMTPERILLAEKKIQRNARMICFAARFMPGLRAPIYLTCGVLRVKPSTFFLQDGLAALISVPIWIYLGNWFGQNLDQALALASKVQMWLISAVALLIVGYIVKKKAFKRKDELLLTPDVTKLENGE
jgi:membrane protein DedA with SNARE-associated domain